MRSSLIISAIFFIGALFFFSFALLEHPQEIDDPLQVRQVVVGEALVNSVPVSLFGRGFSEDLSLYLVRSVDDVQQETQELWGRVLEVSSAGDWLVTSNGDMGITLIRYDGGRFIVSDSLLLEGDIVASSILDEEVVSVATDGSVYLCRIADGKLQHRTKQPIGFKDRFYRVETIGEELFFLGLKHMVIATIGDEGLANIRWKSFETNIRRAKAVGNEIYAFLEDGSSLVLNRNFTEWRSGPEVSGLVMDVASYGDDLVVLAGGQTLPQTTIYTWCTQDGELLRQELDGRYSGIAPDRENNRLYLLSNRREVAVMEANDGSTFKEKVRLGVEHNMVTPFLYRGRFLVGGTGGSKVVISDVLAKEQDNLFIPDLSSENYRSYSDHTEERTKVGDLWISYGDNTFRLLDASGEILDLLQTKRQVHSVGGEYLLICEDAEARAYAVSNEGFREVGQLPLEQRFLRLISHQGLFYGTATRDGMQILSVSPDGIQRVGRFIFPWPYEGEAMAFEIIPQGHYLYLSSVNEGLWILDAEDPRSPRVETQMQDGFSFSHLGEFAGLVYSPDRKLGVRYFSRDKGGFPVRIHVEPTLFVHSIREQDGALWARKMAGEVRLAPPERVHDVYRFSSDRLIFSVSREYLDGEGEIVVRSGRSVVRAPLPKRVAAH